MSDGPADRPDPFQAWLEATGGGQADRGPAAASEPRRMPSARLFVLTAVVCAVAVILGAGVRARTVDPAAPVAGVAAATLAPTPVPTATAAPLRTANGGFDGGDGAGLDPAVTSAAVLAVRHGAGPDIYVDTAAVEAVDRLPDAALVTVAALILRRVPTGWSRLAAARFAVPVSTSGSTPVAMGPPWRLPPRPPAAREPRWRDLQDRRLRDRATAAIRAAGYASVTGVQLRASDELPGVVGVTVRAAAPGDTAVRSHELWLGDDAGTVMGMSPVPPVPVPGQRP